jgi:transcriptional regulator with XRE-family HTH domain
LISQAQLAEKYRPSSEYVSRLERGINAPSIQALNAMSIILKVEIQDLLDFFRIELGNGNSSPGCTNAEPEGTKYSERI